MDSQEYVNWLEAEYQNEAPEPPVEIVVSQAFGYIHFKAFSFLKAGPDEYRKHDALHRPPASLSASRLDAIKRGCEQILRFRGLSPDQPLEGIGIDGFYALLGLLHFETGQQIAYKTEMTGVVVDEMHIRHIVDGRELTLYNMVRQPEGKTESASPCPYCGKPLRTRFAKQCRHCGMDWHDPSNVVCRR